MQAIQITIDNGDYILRLLRKDDSEILGAFFSGLSEESKSRFAPHPLDEAYAQKICNETELNARFVLCAGGQIIGYFILDPRIPEHEAERYLTYHKELLSNRDCMFAPCLADAYQNMGLGSKVMPHLLNYCKKKGYRSLVLLGGTQESNIRALQFYRKSGFIALGGYHTSEYNLDMQLELKG